MVLCYISFLKLKGITLNSTDFFSCGKQKHVKVWEMKLVQTNYFLTFISVVFHMMLKMFFFRKQ